MSLCWAPLGHRSRKRISNTMTFRYALRAILFSVSSSSFICYIYIRLARLSLFPRECDCCECDCSAVCPFLVAHIRVCELTAARKMLLHHSLYSFLFSYYPFVIVVALFEKYIYIFFFSRPVLFLLPYLLFVLIRLPYSSSSFYTYPFVYILMILFFFFSVWQYSHKGI